MSVFITRLTTVVLMSVFSTLAVRKMVVYGCLVWISWINLMSVASNAANLFRNLILVIVWMTLALRWVDV